MDLNTLASLGEFVAGLGVIVSLVYLSLQVRQNTLSVRASTNQAFAEAAGEIGGSLYADPELFKFFEKAMRSPGSLDRSERLRWHLIATRIVRHMESSYYQYLFGTMDSELWAGLDASFRGMASEPGLALWIQRNESRIAAPVRLWFVEMGVIDEASAV